MRTSSTSNLAFPETSTSTPPAPAPSDDQSQSFSDVMHQQDEPATPSKADSASDTPKTAGAKSSKPAATDTTTKSGKTSDVAHAPTPPTAPASIHTKTPILAPTPATTAAPVATAKAPTTTTTSTAPSIPAGSDLATMMVQSMLLAAHARSTTTTSSAADGKKADTSATETGPAAPTSTTLPDIATLLAQAMALPASTTAASATATSTAKTGLATAASAITAGVISTKVSLGGREIPLSTSEKVSNTSSAKEKKSAVDLSEGSFLHSGAAVSTGTSSSSNLTGTAVMGIGNGAENQQVATQANSGKSATAGSAPSAISSVGTAPVEKKSTMSTDLIHPELLAGTNASTALRPAADVNILLSSNNDFEDALKQVVHIAQLNDAAGSITPTRIAIELQTPPGAIVNVYVSKQDDQYRAQLSTTDPAALSWVQDKITTLRQGNDLGVEVKWLPAQIESSPLSATTTSSNDSNLNWNRDGQNTNYQQPDERHQSQRQDQSSYEDLTEVGAEAFSSSLEAVGGAA